MLAVDDWFYPNQYVFHGQRRSVLRPDLVWHVVRHPLAVVASISGFDSEGINPAWWAWQERHTGISPERPWPLLTVDEKIALAARFYIAWNERIENDPAVSFRFRVEALPLGEMAERLGLELPDRISVPPLGARRAAGRLQWNQLGEGEEPLRKIAKRYGYEETQ